MEKYGMGRSEPGVSLYCRKGTFPKIFGVYCLFGIELVLDFVLGYCSAVLGIC
jgi:hypothetical protein